MHWVVLNLPNDNDQSSAIGEMFTCGILGEFLILIFLALLSHFIKSETQYAIISFVSALLAISTFGWYITDIVGFAKH